MMCEVFDLHPWPSLTMSGQGTLPMAYGVGGHIEGFDILEWLEMSGTTLDGGFKYF